MQKHLISTTAIAALACTAAPAWAQQQNVAGAGSAVSGVVVTATRSGEGIPADLLGASVTEVTAEQLEARQVRIVSDVLRDVPGVAVNRTGPAGGFTQVRLRGAEANHTLILIDGIDASDPFRGEFDYATLVAEEAARIEVLRGQQSALYGSNAIGGVISYTTATGAEAAGLRGRIEGGSFGTVSASARAGGVNGPLDYAFSAAGYSTDGVVGAEGGHRKDGYEDWVLAGKTTWNVADNLRLKAVGRYIDTDADTVGQDFSFPPNPATFGRAIDGENSFSNKVLLGLLRGEASFLDNRWTAAVTVQGNRTRRREKTAGEVNFGTNGTRIKESAELVGRFERGAARSALTLAIDHTRETFQNIPIGPPAAANEKRSLENTGYVAEYDFLFADRLGLTAAVRHDDNEHFQNADTYRVQASYRFDNGVRVRAAAGSGITNPTNFELFGFDPGSFIGNPDLKPEKSAGWEAGLDFLPEDTPVQIGATYFRSELRDEIFTSFTPAFETTVGNRTDKSHERGVELNASARLAKQFTIDAAYTHLKATEDGGIEVRRPRNSGSVNLSWREPEGRGGATLSVRYTGQFEDFDFTDPFGEVSRRKLPSFTLVNLAASWKLARSLELFGRVENLFDKQYEEQFTFRGTGRGAFVGVRAGF